MRSSQHNLVHVQYDFIFTRKVLVMGPSVCECSFELYAIYRRIRKLGLPLFTGGPGPLRCKKGLK